MTGDKRRILLALCGLSPQVITETLYALVVQRRPAWIPDEIHVITTGAGKRLLVGQLLGSGKGQFHQFCHDFLPKRTAIRFSSETIYVVPEKAGEIEDVRTIEDNRLLADHIMLIVKALTADENCLIHASLAGGRKTMSVYLGMAMQFFAREQDELSHVLVNAPFENHPEFFYPPLKKREMTVFERMTGQPYQVSTDDSRIELAPLPFVRLRNYSLTDDLAASFGGLVEQAQKKLDLLSSSTRLIFVANSCTLVFGEKEVMLTPVEGALYYVFLSSKIKCRLKRDCSDCSSCYYSPFEIPDEDIIAFLEARWGAMSGRLENVRRHLSERLDRREWFLQHRSRINRKLRRAGMAEDLCIASTGTYGQSVYGIKKDKSYIIIK